MVTGPDTTLLPYRCAFMSLHTPNPTNADARLAKGVASPQCSTKPRNSRHQTLAVPRACFSSPVSSMNTPSRSPSVEAMRAIISQAVPDVSIEAIRPLPSVRPQRDARVKISNDRTLMLTIPPPSMLRLLRSEQWLLLSEALVIPWICRRVLEHAAGDKKISIHDLIDTESGKSDLSRPANTEKHSARLQMSDEPLIKYLPVLIAHSSSSAELGTAFNLTEPTRGTTIFSLPHQPSEADRAAVEYQKGQFIRRISDFKAPNSRFGRVVAVIGSDTSPRESNAATSVGSGGVDTWPKAFLALVEGTLRDGEDLAVTISYSLIRRHMHRLIHLLNAVTQSRLVVLDAGSDFNVLVSSSTNFEEQVYANTSPVEQTPAWKGVNINVEIEAGVASVSCSKETPIAGVVKMEGSKDRQGVAAGNRGQLDHGNETPNISVTGLRDWSNCMFGDPLMTSIFSEEPSPEFLRGFRQQPLSSTTFQTTLNFPGELSPPPDGLIEDRENSPIRLLLYECYHAIVCVVKQFYRPARANGTKCEMDARRRLAAVLNKLAEVDENAIKRPRTASTEIWPVKKPKSDVGTGGVG